MTWQPAPADDLPDIIVLDGDCVLCSRWAKVVHDRDEAHRFRFVAIQSPLGQTLARRFGIDPAEPATNLAVVEGVAYFKSDAALGVLSTMEGWRWTVVLKALPRPVRNWLYDRIARNRYSLFGRQEACWVNAPTFKARVVATADELPKRS